MNTKFGKHSAGNTMLKEVLKPGTPLQGGKYLLVEIYGQGPFTTCYLAQQVLLGRKVIINEFFLPAHCSRSPEGAVINRDLDPALYEQFKNDWFGEAILLTRCVGNEHFVAVLDTFEENSTVYYVTEYINEEDLLTFTLSRPRKRLEEREAVGLIAQITQGLSLLHGYGIFHLNLSPVKVLIDKKGRAVIFSVGIARQKIPAEVRGDPANLARPGYTSPELYEEECTFGAWTDIYSVGAILYFLVTGKDPVPAPDRTSHPLPKPNSLNTSLSEATNRVILKAMDPDPASRYQNLEELIRDLPAHIPDTHRVSTRKPILIPATILAILLMITGLILTRSWFPAGKSPSDSLTAVAGENTREAHAGKLSRLTLHEDKMRGMTMIKDQGAGDSVLIGQYYALLIGIANYRDNRYEKLSEPLNDVGAMKEVLASNYTFREDHIRVLADPDKRTVFQALNYYRDSLRANDNLFVFYAGHGRFDEKSNTGYILPADADFRNDADWISFVEIRKKFEVIPARHVLLIADACYAGSVFRGIEAEPGESPDAMTLDQMGKRSRTAFTSAYLKPVPDRSEFLRQLISNLQNNRQALFLSEDLYINTRNSLLRSTSKKDPVKWGVLQDCGDEGGDFIFIRQPSGWNKQQK